MGDTDTGHIKPDKVKPDKVKPDKVKPGDAEMDHDDRPVGRILNRREVLALLGGAGAVVLAGRLPNLAFAQMPSEETVPGCVVRPEQTEGPFFVEERLERSDLRPESPTGDLKPGVLLALTFRVFGIGESCAPLEGAVIDVWHCDAQGDYSGVSDRTQSFDTGVDTVEQTWLRGFQRTGADGIARFTTVYPGWYPGRAVHIHFKVRTGVTADDYEFTSQLYFDDALSDRVFENTAYVRNSFRDTLNANDFIFVGGGNSLLLEPTETAAGYAANFDIGLDLSSASAGDTDPDRRYPPPPRGPGGGSSG